MSTPYRECLNALRGNPQHWLVTGAAGFIGSHLVQALLAAGQQVRGLDNFATGKRENISDLLSSLPPHQQARFDFIEGDILDSEAMNRATNGVQRVLHQAALGSVTRSVKDPILSNKVNVEGFLSTLMAARNAGVTRIVFASSSSVYGNTSTFPMVESALGSLLSPYAATKRFNELYADVFARLHGLSIIGLRYFNVFGPRQDPQGEYAAVIPRWIQARLTGKSCTVFGDGETSRDFCYIDNTVQANILAAMAPDSSAGTVYNIALGGETSLNKLYATIDGFASQQCEPPQYAGFRSGDIRRSYADISHARNGLGYTPEVSVEEGLRRTVEWHKGQFAHLRSNA